MDTKPENVQFLKSNYPYDGSVFREASTGHHPSNPYASQWRDAGYKPPQEVTMNPDSSLEELLTHPPTLPGTHATPDDIRDFLTYLLVHKRAFPQELARQIAERWTVGSGLELRQYSPSLFFELFGSELGWVLYREVQVWLWREKRFVVKYKTYFSTLLAIIWETVMITLLATETRMSEGMILFTLFSAIIGGIVLFVLIIMLFLGTSAEKMIERELKASAKTKTS